MFIVESPACQASQDVKWSASGDGWDAERWFFKVFQQQPFSQWSSLLAFVFIGDGRSGVCIQWPRSGGRGHTWAYTGKTRIFGSFQLREASLCWSLWGKMIVEQQLSAIQLFFSAKQPETCTPWSLVAWTNAEMSKQMQRETCLWSGWDFPLVPLMLAAVWKNLSFLQPNNTLTSTWQILDSSHTWHPFVWKAKVREN